MLIGHMGCIIAFVELRVKATLSGIIVVVNEVITRHHIAAPGRGSLVLHVLLWLNYVLEVIECKNLVHERS